MALQNLRSNTSHKRPTTAGLSDGQIAINTNSGSAGIFFKDADDNIVKVGPAHVGTSAPNSTPATGGSSGNSAGEFWLDTTGGNYVLKIYDGTDWRDDLVSLATASNDGLLSQSDFTKLSGIAAGAEVNVDTDLSYTAATRVLASSTGDNVTLPLAVASGSAGLLSGADKALIDSALQPTDSINSLSDVDTTTNAPTSGQVLEWDGTNFVPGDVTTAPVDSVNTQTGAVVLDADDIDDTSTTNKFTTAADITKLSGIASGAEVNVDTNLSYTASTRELASSTGTNVTLPEASQSAAGLISSTDKTKLDGIASGAQVNVGTNLTYTASTRVLASSTGNDATLPEATTSNAGLFSSADKTKLDGMDAGAEPNVGTNLSYTASTRELASSTGTNVTLPEVTTSNAGLLSSSDKTKLNGIATGAEVNVQSDWNATSGDAFIQNKPTIPTNNNQLTNGAGYITSADGGNAATLDGIDSSSFLRSDAADTKTSGNLRLNDSVILELGNSADAEFWTNGAKVRLDLNSAINDFEIRNTTSTKFIFQKGGNLIIGGTAIDTVGKIQCRVGGSGSAGTSFHSNNTSLKRIMHKFSDASGTQVGEISIKNATTTYSTSSDYRLKENLVQLAGAIDRVKLLDVYRFNFIGVDETVDGFVAHELAEVVPEAVTGEKDGEIMQGVDQSKVVPLLAAALQEAIAKIESLEQRLTDAGL
jgi:hypothetical protein